MGTTVCNRDRAAAGCEKGTPGGAAPAPARGGSQGAQGACSLHCALCVQPCGASPLLCWRCPGESEAIAAPLVKGLAKRLVVVVPSARLTSLISMVVGGREEVEGEGNHRRQRSPHVSLSPVATRLSHVACEQSTGSARRCSALAPPSRPWYTSPRAGSITLAHTTNIAHAAQATCAQLKSSQYTVRNIFDQAFVHSFQNRGRGAQKARCPKNEHRRHGLLWSTWIVHSHARPHRPWGGPRWRSTHSTQSVNT